MKGEAGWVGSEVRIGGTRLEGEVRVVGGEEAVALHPPALFSLAVVMVVGDPSPTCSLPPAPAAASPTAGAELGPLGSVWTSGRPDWLSRKKVCWLQHGVFLRSPLGFTGSRCFQPGPGELAGVSW